MWADDAEDGATVADDLATQGSERGAQKERTAKRGRRTRTGIDDGRMLDDEKGVECIEGGEKYVEMRELRGVAEEPTRPHLRFC